MQPSILTLGGIIMLEPETVTGGALMGSVAITPAAAASLAVLSKSEMAM